MPRASYGPGSLRIVKYLMIFNDIFVLSFSEKFYEESAVRVPSLSQLSDISKDLGLDIEGSELMAYRGRILRYL